MGAAFLAAGLLAAAGRGGAQEPPGAPPPDIRPGSAALGILERLWASMAFYPPDMLGVLRTIPVAPQEMRRHIREDMVMRHYDEILAAKDCQPKPFGALACAELGLMREAVALADSAVDCNPDFPTARSVRAYVRFQLGDLRGSAEDSRWALRLNPGEQAAEALLRLSEGNDRLPGFAPPGSTPEAPIPRPAPDARGVPSSPGAPLAARPQPEAKGGPGLLVVIAVLSSSILIALSAMRAFGWAWTKVTTKTAVLPVNAPAPGAGLRDYEIIRAVGRGGMGVVYEAKDRVLDRRVAVKKMRAEIADDPRERERFLKEARFVASLHHPAIVAIHAVVDDGGDLAIVFEYVDGKTVDALLAERGSLGPAEVKDIFKPLCEALDYAHGRQIVHRDLKPSNVMVSTDGAVKVMDFGIARRAKDTVAKLSMTSTVAGTPLYMAPEAEEGVVCRESDVYSLGAMMYELLAGRPPFPPSAGGATKREKRYDRLLAVAPSLPPALDALIDAALEPRPEARVHTAGEFWERLSAA